MPSGQATGKCWCCKKGYYYSGYPLVYPPESGSNDITIECCDGLPFGMPARLYFTVLNVFDPGFGGGYVFDPPPYMTVGAVYPLDFVCFGTGSGWPTYSWQSADLCSGGGTGILTFRLMCVTFFAPPHTRWDVSDIRLVYATSDPVLCGSVSPSDSCGGSGVTDLGACAVPARPFVGTGTMSYNPTTGCCTAPLRSAGVDFEIAEVSG